MGLDEGERAPNRVERNDRSLGRGSSLHPREAETRQPHAANWKRWRRFKLPPEKACVYNMKKLLSTFPPTLFRLLAKSGRLTVEKADAG